MFRSKTLFIIGAGASKEIGFPIGTELAKKISHLLKFRFDCGHFREGNRQFLSSLRRFFGDGPDLQDHLKVGNQISGGIHLANSIDNYIDTHQHNSKISLCGKTAIIHTILEAERNSSLYIDKKSPNDPINYNHLEETWYVKFVRILFEQVPLNELNDLFNEIAIVCFNYDRCIQHFLIHAVSSHYSIHIEDTRKLVGGLQILHPYGSVGHLPRVGINDGIEFGQDTTYVNIVNLSESIKTYTEQVEENELLKNVRKEVSEAKTIVFLGFGFHPQNMSLLSPTIKTNAKRVFATAQGVSNSDLAVIEKRVRLALMQSDKSKNNNHRLNIQVRNDLSCANLFSEYRLTLAS